MKQRMMRAISGVVVFLMLAAWVPAFAQGWGTGAPADQGGWGNAGTEPPEEEAPPEGYDNNPYDPQLPLMTVVEPQLEFDPTSVSPLGDDYDPASGTVTFSATDISLPGNFDIPVELRRWVPQDDYDTGGPGGALGMWRWNIPFIRGNYLDVKQGHSDAGWDWGDNTWHDGYNCTGDAHTVWTNSGTSVAPEAYWQGKLLHIPGVTSETFLRTDSGQQVTKSNFRIVDCISNFMEKGGGVQQGIVVAGPNGLRYTFNRIKSYYNNKSALKSPVVWTRLLLVTKIEDRYGNYVNYSYDANSNLTGIAASDGRAIVVSAGATSATAHGRTWQYGALPTGQDTVTLPDGSQWVYEGLSAVRFDANGLGGYNQEFRLLPSPVLPPGCTTNSAEHIASVTTPQGLKTTYTFKDTIHTRSNVEADFYQDQVVNPLPGQLKYITRALQCTVKRSLKSRTVQGPGVGPHTWTYAYSTNRGTFTATSCRDNICINNFLPSTSPNLPQPAASLGGFPAPVASGGAENYRSVTITGPDKKLVFYIDRQAWKTAPPAPNISEGMVVAQDVLNADGDRLLQRTEYTHAMGNIVGQYWYVDGDEPPNNMYQSNYRTNQILSVEKRPYYNSAGSITSTDTFTTQTSLFDDYGFAQFRQESNNVVVDPPNPSPMSRQVWETRQHLLENAGTANEWRWIGLPLSQTVNGTATVGSTYNSYGQRATVSRFGQLQQTLTYETSMSVASGQRGTLKTFKDGRNQITTYGSWKRGIPQSILYADGGSQSAVVNDRGWIDSITGENGAKTCYLYDERGQIERITYPSETVNGVCNPTAWEMTERSFEKISSAIHGLSAGHWKETISTGNAHKEVFYDALWRPVRVREYDNANATATQRFSKVSYDIENRVTFASYPNTVGDPTTGTSTLFDALGRVTSVSQNSELGLPATTTTHYLAGLKTRVTNPRGHNPDGTLNFAYQTTTSYQAFGAPSYDAPLAMSEPEGVATAIVRDVFGKPSTIKRTGTYWRPNGTAENQSLTRRFVYDAQQRLCRRIDPESGSAVFDYDAAGNLAWSGRSTDQANTSACLREAISVADRSIHTYDARNRLTSINHPAGTDDVGYGYEHGLLKTASTTSGGAWTYTYHKRGLPMTESLVIDNTTFGIAYAYNALGHLSSMTYPSGLSMAFTPNALGQATQVGGYAYDVSYHPDGSLKGFIYANGIEHSRVANVRGLPETLRDTLGPVALLDHTYTYDKNGNLMILVDSVNDPDYQIMGRESREMIYDDRDRLISAKATNKLGYQEFEYDALDNVRRWRIHRDDEMGQHDQDFRYRHTTSNRLDGIDDETGAPQWDYEVDALGQTTQRKVLGPYNGYPTELNFAWDKAGRVTGVAYSGGTNGAGSETYRYDAHGRRTRSARDGGMRYQVYSRAGQLVYTQDERENQRIDYVSLGGRLIAKRSRPMGSNSATSTFLHVDQRGTPSVETDSAGARLDRAILLPYGSPADEVFREGPGFTGHQTDSGTGLIYMQQRYYDPVGQRFFSVDPVDVSATHGGNFSRYWYANNNPYRYTDSDGRFPWLIVPAVIGMMVHSDVANAPAPGEATETLTPMDHLGAVPTPVKSIQIIKSISKVADKVQKSATARRVTLRKDTREQIKENQPRNSQGEMVDPNSGQPLKPGKIDVGHKPGEEWRTRKAEHEAAGSTRQQVIDAENNPNLYQLEDRSSNRSHRYEEKPQ